MMNLLIRSKYCKQITLIISYTEMSNQYFGKYFEFLKSEVINAKITMFENLLKVLIMRKGPIEKESHVFHYLYARVELCHCDFQHKKEWLIMCRVAPYY